MTADNDDSLLDAFLAEVLGNRQPPDLTDRILKAWAEQAANKPKVNGHVAAFPSPQLASPSQSNVSSSPAVCLQLPQQSQDGALRGRRHAGILALSLAAAVIGVGLSVGLWSVSKTHHGPLAKENTPAAKPSPVESPQIAHANPAVESTTTNEVTPTPAVPPVVAELAIITTPAAPVAPTVVEVAVAPVKKPRSTDTELVFAVNAELEKLWVSASVKPAAMVADDEWCQRVYKALLGRGARPAEVKRFTELPEATRRQRLVDRLLTDRRYQEEFTQHWAANWTTRFIGPRGGLGNSLAKREELQGYFATAIRAGKPWSAVVQELLTATGSATAEGEDYNPAVNFLLDRWDSNALTATSRVSHVVLGHRLQCAQCHQHPTEGWSQEQFWSLNAFFRQMRVDRTSGTPALTNVDFVGQRRGSQDGEVFFETPTGLMKIAFPRFLDGTEIATSGLLSSVDRRQELAQLVIQSDDFAEATVNFVWTQIYGYGLARSASEQASESPHARILHQLATEFVASEYNLKSVIRWAVLADPFSRSAQLTDVATNDLPEAGETPLFSRFYGQPQPRAETNRLLVAAARIRTTSATESARKQARRDWLMQANRVEGKAGKNAKNKAAPPSTSIIANAGPPSNIATSVRDGGLIARLVASRMPFEKKAEHVFLAAIGRQPNTKEATTAGELLTASGNSETAALEDLWWALVNSNECLLDR